MGADPVSLGLIVGGAGLGLQLLGQKQAQDAQQREMLANAEAARENARLAILEAEQNAKIQQIQSEKITSAIGGQFAAANVEGGTVFDVIANSVRNAEMDRLGILYAGELKSRSLLAQAGAYEGAAGSGSNLGLIGTGLGGIGNLIGRMK